MSGGPAGASDLVLTNSRIAAVAGGIILIGADITAIAALVSTNTASIITTNESLDATDIAVGLKADKLTTYTKTESDALITNLVNSAPATLDTLKEIADALGNDADLAGNLTTSIGTKAATKDVTASLLLKADKLTTYNKEETDNKISAVVGLAPATLNTIKKVALAINNDDNFSTTITTLIGKKATATDMTASLALKTDKTLYDALETAVSLKAIATEVTASLALKTDKTLYDALETAVGLKAIATDVTDSLLLKTDKTDHDDLVTAVGLKAIATDVTDSLLLKSDVSSVNGLITHIQNTYYTITAAATALGYKANTSGVYSTTAANLQFATKASHTALLTEVGLRAVATDVVDSLALKTDKTLYDALVTAVGLKAIATDVVDSLALKTDKTLYDALVAAVGLKAVATNVYTIAAADLQFATILSYNALVTALGLKAVATNVYTIAAAALQFATQASYTTLATAVGLKALATDVYTKLEITDALA